VKKGQRGSSSLLSDDQPGSALSRSRLAFIVVIVGAAVVSLFFSPMPLPLVLIYAGIGVVAGLLQLEPGDDLGAVVGLAILVVGTSAGPIWLTPLIAPQWNADSWQAGLIALAAVGLVHLTQALRRLRGRSHSTDAKG